MMVDNAKKIDNLMKEMRKAFRREDDVISRLSEDSYDGAAIPTGSYLLDVATGIGGVPHGRIIEIYGDESSGKTSLSLSIVAQAQKMGMLTAWLDFESTLVPSWAKTLGVKLEDLLKVNVESLENGIDKIMWMAKNGMNVIVLDSLAGAITDSEADDGAMAGDRTIGLKARVLSQNLPRLVPVLAKNGCTLIIINQTRVNVGQMYGNPETTPGGKALRFYSSLRLRTAAIRSKTVTVKENGVDVPIGHTVRVKIVKNKVGAPGKQADTMLFYDRGFDPMDDLITIGKRSGLIRAQGSWMYPEFLYEDMGTSADDDGAPKFQGSANFIDYLRDHPAAYALLESRVREVLNLNFHEVSFDQEAEEDTPD